MRAPGPSTLTSRSRAAGTPPVDNPGRQASSTPGANVSNSIAQSNPYTTTATNAQVTTLAQDLLTQMEPIFPGITKQWNGRAMLSTRSPTLTSSAPTPTGNRASTPPSAATKRRGSGTSTSPASIARRLPRLHGRRRLRRPASSQRSPRRPEEDVGRSAQSVACSALTRAQPSQHLLTRHRCCRDAVEKLEEAAGAALPAGVISSSLFSNRRRLLPGASSRAPAVGSRWGLPRRR